MLIRVPDQAGDLPAGQTLESAGEGNLFNLVAPGGISDGNKGDITVSGGGTAWTLNSGGITYAKIQNVSATDRVLGRSSPGAGPIEEIVCTGAGRALIDDPDAATQRATLGLTSYDPGTVSFSTEQFMLQYGHLKLSGPERATLAGTSEIVLTDFNSFQMETLGTPYQRPGSFRLPSGNYHVQHKRLTLDKVSRAVLEGASDFLLIDITAPQSRATMTGRS